MELFGGNDKRFGRLKLKQKERGDPVKFTLKGGKGYLGESGDVVVIGFQMNMAEKYASLACFGDKNHIYAFGHDAQNSTIQLTFVTNLDKQCGKKQLGIKTAMDRYKKSRLSREEISIVTVGTETYTGRVVAMTSRSLSPELNLQTITYTIIVPGVD